jgi:predicted nuclease with TOPRIM domain
VKMLRELKGVLFLKQRIKELEALVQGKDETIKRLEEENASLQERVKELVLKCRDINSEVAGLNYRLYELSRDNKILENQRINQWVMNYLPKLLLKS